MVRSSAAACPETFRGKRPGHRDAGNACLVSEPCRCLLKEHLCECTINRVTAQCRREINPARDGMSSDRILDVEPGGAGWIEQ